MELGQTSHPRDLVPGDPAALHEQARIWERAETKANEVAEALRKFTPPDGWTGAAREAFVERVASFVPAWDAYADACGKAFVLTSDFAEAVTVAQARAADAIDLWEAGQRATAEAQAAYQRAVNDYWFFRPTVRTVPAFVDAGAASRAEAEAVLAEARAVLRDEGDAAAARLERVADQAPQQASPWAIGASMLQLSYLLITKQAEHSSAEFADGVLSFGNALIEHPDIALEFLAGLMGMISGGSMALGGGALTVASVGAAAPVSAPLAVAGVGVFAAGATALGHAAVQAAEHSGTDSRVHMNERHQERAADGTFAEGNGGSRSSDWYAKEQKGLDDYAERTQKEVIRDQVKATVDGADNGRFFDGLVKNRDGTYTAIEVKSGTGDLTRPQKTFDDLVSRENPARAILNGEEIWIVKVVQERV